MPETKKGVKIRRAMQRFYGKKKGEQVYYAAINKGRLRGTHPRNSRWERQARAGFRKRGRRGVYRNAYALSPKHRLKISRGLKWYHRRRGHGSRR